ncbi:hypothetical protein HNR77_005585 [Paenibacillus sp. JGP012]|nr:hypothetical protein [Paenibacillus sp. JGP012]
MKLGVVLLLAGQERIVFCGDVCLRIVHKKLYLQHVSPKTMRSFFVVKAWTDRGNGMRSGRDVIIDIRKNEDASKFYRTNVVL